MRPFRLIQIVLGGMIACGCCGALLNESCIQSMGGAANLPVTPGQTDYILLRVENGTEMPPGASGFEWAVEGRHAGGASEGLFITGGGLSQGEDIGHLVECTMTAVTPGSLTDPTAPGAWLVYNPIDPVLKPLPPLGVTLQNGVHFRCGDTITFMTVKDESVTQGFRITWRVESGQAQTGPYVGPDAFALYERELQEHDAEFAQYFP